MQRTTWILWLISGISLATSVHTHAQGPSLAELRGMRENYHFWSGGLPLGDINRGGIGNAPAGYGPENRLIFSESISYYLFAHVMPMLDANEDELRERFINAWEWTKQNMQRKNVSQVFDWPSQTWTNMPTHLQDSLLCWRYVRQINGNPDDNGIIYTTLNDENMVWHDGSQVASDGDILVAYSLLLAARRGWGDYLRDDALEMLADIRAKCVVDLKAGEIFNTLDGRNRFNTYGGYYSDTHADPSNGVWESVEDADGAYGFQGRHSYSGWFFDPPLDFSELVDVEVTVRGEIGANARVKLMLEDSAGVADGSVEGHIVRSPPIIALGVKWAPFVFTHEAFVKNEGYGLDGSFDWSSVKNVQLQIERDSSIARYHEKYDNGEIEMRDVPGHIAWTGKKCFVGFDFLDTPVAMSNAVLHVIVRGEGSYILIVEDDNGGISRFGSGNGAHVSLQPALTTNSFPASGFVRSNWPQGIPAANMNRIKKIQIQNDQPASLTLREVRIDLPDESRTVVLDNGEVQLSTVFVRSVRASLGAESGQTSANDGPKLISNAHEALHVNPSYFMPFAFRLFAIEDEPQWSGFWTALIDSGYEEINATRSLVLHDLDGGTVTNNGSLIPDWYAFDPLTGQRVDVPTQTPYSNVRGYKHSYDAFRTLYWLSLDAHMQADPRAQAGLDRARLFFLDALSKHGRYHPRYRMDGTIEDADVTELAGVGFPAVYIGVFRNDDTQAIQDTWDAITNALRHAPDGRVWFADDDPGFSHDEYFMNLWGLFGCYLHAMKADGALDRAFDGLANDLNGDGIGDRWALLMFGSENYDPDADPDRDGASNRFEFQHGLNPLVYDTAGPLVITGVANDVVLNVATVPSMFYTIEMTTNLAAPSWTELDVLNGNGGILEWRRTASHPTEFYRVRPRME